MNNRSPEPISLEDIERDRIVVADFLLRLRQKGVTDRRVLAAMEAVPRRLFVPHEARDTAYLERALPIECGQTISAPELVAMMTQALDCQPDHRALEIGTGSGYQAAVLSGLVKKVYTIEIIRELGESARERLSRLGYTNVEVRVADGYFGWEERLPFDSIIVTAAAGHVPPPLIRQLKPGGRIVIPVGGTYQVQMLMVVTKDASGTLKTRQVLPVRFVPLTGKAGQ
jgi:protein-L-isoaspartate(D-aspartate) O-methyltransferase